MHLSKFVHSKTGRLFMSLILGLGLASLFRKLCSKRNCIIFHAPPMKDIESKVYKEGNKCYKFNSVATKCDKSKKIVSFSEDNIAYR